MENHLSDLELVALINDGDWSALDGLYQRHRDWAFRLALRFVGHRDDALDVVQEAFTYIVTLFPGFELTAKFTTFLYPVIRHRALRAIRIRRRMIGGVDDDLLHLAPAPADERSASRAELADVIATLPNAQREVVLMRFVDGFTNDEIATALEIPAGTVKSRLHNALAALRDDPKTRRYFGQEDP
ncbi:MAG: sigma-70 family RNA polymerase sigma factor [Phycisphaerales bacterium]|nr:sigma-70 family RNA polymerase sigma factor [Phycisphaerales bacterium]